MENCSSSYRVFDQFSKDYKPAHIHLSWIICSLGILGNICNIRVFTHKSIRGPTNFLISCLSAADTLILLTCLLVTCLESSDYGDTYPTKVGAYTFLSVLTIQNFVHSVGTWMTVALGTFRLVYVKLGHRAAAVCTMHKAYALLVAVIVSSLVLGSSYIVSHEVKPVSNSTTINYKIEVSLKYGGIVLWTNALFFKSIPILILAGVSAILIKTIQESQKLHNKLLLTKKAAAPNNKKATAGLANKDKDRRNSNQITLMLVCIILIQIITLLPQVG
ncbi:hypothetical protein Ciccas_008271 [Cichlidogyrus casuarinus]|uniref:G-protein coupled receptors family 1 profile domain-containing protein n=1 Tax=Cichlidogyrus casuarinus TaxID=1844966 RepID=A0ABD2Q0J5_9PLAT